VFLITGRHEIADQTRARGITGFFRKPFDGTALLSAIGEAIGAQRNEGTDHE
jgi:FixJ family two-component response regulator